MSGHLLAIGSDSKTPKGESLGYLTGILYLLPAKSADDGVDLCPFSTPECERDCIVKQGRGAFSSVHAGRARKRALFVRDRAGFVAQLHRDIAALVRKAQRLGLRPAVRLNGTSDIAWELIARELFAAFPMVTYYDYTKVPVRAERWKAGKFPPNYSLTFSRSERNERAALAMLRHGANVAVVFGTPKGAALPETWHGYRVVDGDVSDLRFLDPPGTVVGLRAKGSAKKNQSTFVVRGMSPAQEG